MVCFAYVFPCVWEDHCKIGFSRDPLSRIQALHRRWFEFFDLDGALLIEAETERDARDLELALRRPLASHRAPAPTTVRRQAGGWTEWVRGATSPLQAAVRGLERSGYIVHAPARPWLREALAARSDALFSWTRAQLSPDERDGLAGATPAQALVRDALAAYAAFGVDLAPLLPEEVHRWYRSG